MATAVLLLTQVPPLVGDSVVVVVPQKEVGPVIFTTGKACTVTAGVVFAQLGAVELVKVKVALPGPTAVMVLPLTVATAVLLLTQVPPLAGDKVAVAPLHIAYELELTMGNAVTV